MLTFCVFQLSSFYEYIHPPFCFNIWILFWVICPAFHQISSNFPPWHPLGQGTKLVAAHFGGTRTPMVMSWPKVGLWIDSGFPEMFGSSSRSYKLGIGLMITGWWFGTFFFHTLGMSSSQLTNIIQRGGSTTNQIPIGLMKRSLNLQIFQGYQLPDSSPFGIRSFSPSSPGQLVRVPRGHLLGRSSNTTRRHGRSSTTSLMWRPRSMRPLGSSSHSTWRGCSRCPWMGCPWCDLAKAETWWNMWIYRHIYI